MSAVLDGAVAAVLEGRDDTVDTKGAYAVTGQRIVVGAIAQFVHEGELGKPFLELATGTCPVLLVGLAQQERSVQQFTGELFLLGVQTRLCKAERSYQQQR